MKTLDLYIAGFFFKAFIAVLAVPGVLFSFFELMSQLESVGRGSYTNFHALLYVFYTMPGRLSDLVPMAVLLAGIISLGALSDRHELVAMQASGMSVLRISMPVMSMCLVIMLISSLAGETMVPYLEKKARNMRFQKLSGRAVTPISHGFWARFKGSIIHVENVVSDGTVSGIEIFEFERPGKLSRVIRAQSAEILKDRWVLNNVTSTSMMTMKKHQVPEITLRDFLNPEQVSALELPPSSFTVPELMGYIEALEKSGQNPDHYSMALWRKLANPLTTAAMALLSLSFVFGSVREIGAGFRIVAGAFAGLALYFGQQLVINIGTYLALPPFLSVMIPVVIVWGLAGITWRNLGVG